MADRIPEHTIVITIEQVVEDATVIPKNNIGTIVHIYPSGYLVEFFIDNNSQVVYCPDSSIISKKESLK